MQVEEEYGLSKSKSERGKNSMPKNTGRRKMKEKQTRKEKALKKA